MKTKAQVGPPYVCDGCRKPIDLGNKYNEIKGEIYCSWCWTGEGEEEGPVEKKEPAAHLKEIQRLQTELERAKTRIDRLENKLAALIRTVLGGKKREETRKKPEAGTLTDELIRLRAKRI